MPPHSQRTHTNHSHQRGQSAAHLTTQPDAEGGGRCAPAHADATATGAGSRAPARPPHGTACPCAISLLPGPSGLQGGGVSVDPTAPAKPHPSKDSAVLKLWPDGSRADIPGTRFLNPKALTDPPLSPPKTKRGKVTGFSAKSRRNFLRKLCTLIRSEVPHTMALTLPGDWEQFDQAFLHLCFKKLGERFCAKCNREPHWAKIALAWKKELQKRGALHWHLLFYGIEDGSALAAEVHRWFADQWNELICAGLSESERMKHAVWHQHEKNWELVDKVAYFTKYVGKAQDLTDEECSTGRWWGLWRSDSLPWAKAVEGTISNKVAVDVNRFARKARQRRADLGKFAALAAAVKFNPFDPTRPLTQWDLQRLLQGYTRRGYRPDDAREYLEAIQLVAKSHGLRIGKFKFKVRNGAPHPNEMKITLTGKTIPDTIRRVAEWSAQRHGLRKPKERQGPFRPKLP